MAEPKFCAPKNLQSITRLKEIDEEYRTTLINFAKYKLVMFAMAKLMEMETTEQNKVTLYLYNSIIAWYYVYFQLKMCYNISVAGKNQAK